MKRGDLVRVRTGSDWQKVMGDADGIVQEVTGGLAWVHFPSIPMYVQACPTTEFVLIAEREEVELR